MNAKGLGMTAGAMKAANCRKKMKVWKEIEEVECASLEEGEIEGGDKEISPLASPPSLGIHRGRVFPLYSGRVYWYYS